MKREMMTSLKQNKEENEDIVEIKEKINLAPGYLEEYGMVTGRLGVEDYEKLKVKNQWIEGQVDRKFAKKISNNDNNKKAIHKTNSSI